MELQLHSFKDTKEFREFDEVSGIYALIDGNEVIYVG